MTIDSFALHPVYFFSGQTQQTRVFQLCISTHQGTGGQIGGHRFPGFTVGYHYRKTGILTEFSVRDNDHFRIKISVIATWSHIKTKNKASLYQFQ
jgi:hypothetical protein